jgi:hypothetical protein
VIAVTGRSSTRMKPRRRTTAAAREALPAGGSMRAMRNHVCQRPNGGTLRHHQKVCNSAESHDKRPHSSNSKHRSRSSVLVGSSVAASDEKQRRSQLHAKSLSLRSRFRSMSSLAEYFMGNRSPRSPANYFMSPSLSSGRFCNAEVDATSDLDVRSCA